MKRNVILGIVSITVVLVLLGAMASPVAAEVATEVAGYTVIPLYDVEKEHQPGSAVPIKLRISGGTIPNSVPEARAVSLTPEGCGELEAAGKSNQGNVFRTHPKSNPKVEKHAKAKNWNKGKHKGQDQKPEATEPVVEQRAYVDYMFNLKIDKTAEPGECVVRFTIGESEGGGTGEYTAKFQVR